MAPAVGATHAAEYASFLTVRYLLSLSLSLCSSVSVCAPLSLCSSLSLSLCSSVSVCAVVVYDCVTGARAEQVFSARLKAHGLRLAT